MKTFRQWLESMHDVQTIMDIAEYGADGGFDGLTYYGHTSALYEMYYCEIWEAMELDAEDMGYEDVLTFIDSLPYADITRTPEGFECACVWYMAEREARMYMDRNVLEEC